MTEEFVSYAQHGEDVILWRALRGTPRFYVDVGAFDPTEDSVTRALYERGWRGMNVEPQAQRLARFELERPEDINVLGAAGDHDGSQTLHRPRIDGWATVKAEVAAGYRADGDTPERITVPAWTLDTLFARYGITAVDVLKIDVEGAEYEVLRGLDLTTVRPRVVVVEGMAPVVGRAAGDRAVGLLVAAGYTHCLFDGLNHYLTCEADLAAALAVPANPLDDYVRAVIPKYDEAIAAYENERRTLHAEIAALVAAASASDPSGGSAAPLDDAELPGPESGDAEPGAYIPSDAQAAAIRRREIVRRQLAARPLVARVVGAPVLAAPPDAAQAPAPPSPPPPPRVTIADALAEDDPAACVAALFLAVLGRPVDHSGADTWSRELTHGRPGIDVAADLAASAEALERPMDARRSIAQELASLRARAALARLGFSDAVAAQAHATSSPQVVTVLAVYQLSVGRAPDAAELTGGLEYLAAGNGRAGLLHIVATSPEAVRRSFGDAEHAGHRVDATRDWVRRARLLVRANRYIDAAEREQVAYLMTLTALKAP